MKKEEDIVYEYCPHCEEEVILSNDFKVQVCPNCGMHIVPCSICDLLAIGRCRGHCKLEEEAKKLNGEL